MSSLGSSFTPTYHHEPYPALETSRAAGKSVVITGGGSGIGRAIARAFAHTSAKNIILIGRTVSKLQETKVHLEQILQAKQAENTKITILQADVTNENAVANAFNKIKQEIGSVDVLINNAGHLPDLKPLVASDLDELWQGFETNVKGTITVFKSFLPLATLGATVINISSNIAHLPPFPGASAYSASKMATVRLVEYIQKENESLRAFNVHPGLITTEMSSKGDVISEDSEDLPAAFCLWLLDPKADFLRGRFLWANWDVDELCMKKGEIVERNMLRSGIRGWNE